MTPSFEDRVPAFAEELMKLAFKKTPKGKALAEAQRHFDAADKDWGRFEKNLKTKSFQKVVAGHPQADDKLREYVKNYGGYLVSKKTVAKVKGDSGKTYTLKQVGDRLGCGCKDWQYSRSHRGTDCKHVRRHHTEKAAAMVKESFLKNLAYSSSLVGQKTLGAKSQLTRGIVARGYLKDRQGQELKERMGQQPG